MGLNELGVLRKQTDSFISVKPVSIALSRTDPVPDGAGGFTTPVPMTRVAQTFRLIPTGREIAFRRSVDGEELQPDYVMLGKWDADVKRGDWFFISGIKYEVLYVRPDTSYEVWAEVVSRG